MGDFYVSVGQRTEFTKTVGETDVYLFAGVTGDFAPNHVNQQYMERSSYGTRMAHGALLVGFMSTASSMAIADTRDAAETPVSVGYDRVRFLRPVLLGDTITVAYTIAAINRERRRSTADIQVTNQRDELVAVAQHILHPSAWVPNDPSGWLNSGPVTGRLLTCLDAVGRPNEPLPAVTAEQRARNRASSDVSRWRGPAERAAAGGHG